MAMNCINFHEPLRPTKQLDNLRGNGTEEVKGKEEKVTPRLLGDGDFNFLRVSMVPYSKETKKWSALPQAMGIGMSIACHPFENTFDSVNLKDKCLECKARLKSDHELVLSKSFESGVQKISED